MGELIRKAREDSGLTQEQLAEKIYVRSGELKEYRFSDSRISWVHAGGQNQLLQPHYPRRQDSGPRPVHDALYIRTESLHGH